MDQGMKQTVKECILSFKNTKRPQHSPPPDEVAVYQLNYDIDPRGKFRAERFRNTFHNGILHRPLIVQAMKDLVFNSDARITQGLFVKGPQGIGKSHSLADLVQVLRAEGHLVTFIPNCEQWDDEYDLLEAICRSMGTSLEKLGINYVNDCSKNPAFLRKFLTCIIDTTREHEMSWILVLDQLNRIFGRKDFQRLKDVGVLPQPFKLMKDLNQFEHVHTIITASANNSLAYREHHEDFLEYDHPIDMTAEEIRTWKPECAAYDDQQFQSLLDVTGGCPLQIFERLRMGSVEAYEQKVVVDVVSSMEKLLEVSSERARVEIARHAVLCLLSIPKTDYWNNIHDKKYSIISDGFVKPLFPAVLIAYRSLFWDNLMTYVTSHESQLLRVCSNPLVSNSVRGRLFELIVITRFQKLNLVSKQPDRDVLPAKVDTGMVFESQELPIPETMQEDTLFIPKNSNFPAIDLILKDAKNVWAIQVHVADHDDVEPKFRRMCQSSGWFNYFDNIFLVYVGPSLKVKQALTCYPIQPSRQKLQQAAKKRKDIVQISALTKDDFECLKSIQWPDTLSNDDMQVSH
jgi:hypothetical protein